MNRVCGRRNTAALRALQGKAFAGFFLWLAATSTAHALNIYRSVGGTAVVSSGAGANTVSINAGTGAVTFSTARPNKVGVGDGIFYDSDNDTTIDEVCFITARTSSTQYTCQARRGGLPVATSVATNKWAIYRAYVDFNDIADYRANGFHENSGLPGGYAAGLKDFDNFDRRDLVANTETWNFAFYNDGAAIPAGFVNSATDAVTGTGFWNTSTVYRVRLYAPSALSEVGVSQRHGGYWDSTKATIQSSDYNIFTVAAGLGDITVEGLQFTGPTDNTNHDQIRAIEISGTVSAGEPIIRNNLFRNYGDRAQPGGTSSSFTQEGVAVYLQYGGPTTSVIRIYNNVFFSTLGTNNWGTGVYATQTSRAYVYNNTFSNLFRGISTDLSANPATAELHVANNLMQGCNLCMDKEATMTNWTNEGGNITSDASSINVAGRNVTTSFVDAANGNFRLATTSTAALTGGVDLSGQFTTDIDGSERSTPWSVGADHPTLQIYRSLGYLGAIGTALATGTGNALTVAGSTATFGSVDLPANVGVGDAIQYDSDGNGSIDSVAFIHARGGPRSYTVKSASGGTPQAVVGDNDWKIFRAYDSLFGVTRGEESLSLAAAITDFDQYGNTVGTHDLKARDVVWNIAAYAGAEDRQDNSSYIYWDGWTTSRLNYARVYTPVSTTEVGVSQRHTGKWTAATAAYTIDTSNDYNRNSVMWVLLNNIRFEGIQLYRAFTDSNDQYGIWFDNSGGGDIYVTESIIRGYAANTQNYHMGLLAYPNGAGPVNGSTNYYFRNNVIYDWTGSASSCGVNTASDGNVAGDRVYAYNNTLNNVRIGFWHETDTSIQYVLKNNLVQNAVDGYRNDAGSWGAASTNNLSNVAADATDGPTTNAVTSSAVTFINAAAGDFHLSGGPAVDGGVSLAADGNLPFTTDIEGATRTGTWDLGADESAGATLVITADTSANWGNVALSTAVNYVFTVTNSSSTVGATSLAIVAGALNAPYTYTGGTYPGTATTPCGTTLAASGTCKIGITFTPTVAGAANDSIELQYNNGTSLVTTTLAVTGTGVAPASLAITADVNASWGPRLVGGSYVQLFTVTNSGTGNATGVIQQVAGALSAPYQFTGGTNTFPGTNGTCTATINAGTNCKLELVYAPVAIGATTDDVILEYNNGLTTTTASLTLSGTGVQTASLSVTGGGSGAFGSVMANQVSASQSYTITNGGLGAASGLADNGTLAAPFRYKGGSYPGTGGDCGATLAAAAACTVVVEFAPASVGAASSSVVLGYSDGLVAQTVTQALTGTGAADTLAPAQPQGFTVE